MHRPFSQCSLASSTPAGERLTWVALTSKRVAAPRTNVISSAASQAVPRSSSPLLSKCCCFLQLVLATQVAQETSLASSQRFSNRLIRHGAPAAIPPTQLSSRHSALRRGALAAVNHTSPLTTSFFSAWRAPCRFAGTGRRPTYTEIAEALAVLGVSIDEDSKIIKKKYRELVKKNHPDAGGDEATMAKVTVAYERLGDLTTREREEFKTQRKYFGGGGEMGSGGHAGSRRYRPGAPSAYGYGAPHEPFQARAANMYGQYYQQDANTAYQQTHGAQSTYWNQFHSRAGGGGFAQSPFTAGNPFSMHAQAQRARYMPSSTILLQGFVIYLILSSFFLFLYRRYRDWRQDDGWRMSESLARHEQMQEMHRIRQEMNERARAMLASDGVADPSLMPMANGLYGDRQYVGDSGEARALEYARQRRIQMMREQQEAAQQAQELRGWPQVEEDKGRIIKRAQDPPGIVYFEPRLEDTRRRQIENLRKASGFTRRAESRTPTGADAESMPVPNPKSSNSSVATADGANAAIVPPESNASAIVMTPVQNEQEAQAVMRGIFSGLRRNSS